VKKQAPRPITSNEKQWIAPAVVGLIAFIAYANSFVAGLAFDSRGLILDDARVHGWTGGNLSQIWEHTYWWPVGESGLYRPFTTVSYLFNYAVLGNGGWAGGYHTINFLLHVLNGLLVWLIARRFWKERWPPALIATLWAVHPVLTESVTNVAGRADVLAGTALLSGFLFYLKSRQDKRWLLPLMLATALGVFSKESAVVIVAIIVLYELCGRSDDRWRPPIRGCCVVIPPILWMLYQRSVVLGSAPPAEFPFTDNPLVGVDFWSARLGALNVLGRYIGLLVWPVPLSCDYSYAQIAVPSGWWPLVPLAAFIALVAWLRSRTALFVACAAFLVLLPSSNLILPIGTIMAERFLYLPSLAFAALVVWAAYRFQPKRAPMILGAVIALYTARTLVRNADWENDLTLADSAVRVCPASYKAHKMRANALLASDPTHGNLDQVIAEMEKSLAILDSLPPSRSNFDTYQRAAEYCQMRGGDAHNRRAVELYRRALTMSSVPNAGIHMQLAKLYVKLGDPRKAFVSAEGAREIDPSDPASHRTLAGVLLDADREQDAVVALVAGVVITQDEALRQHLFRLYRAGLDPAGCAVTASGEWNMSCATVQRELCAASGDIARLRPDLARRMGSFGCR
jgi:hypothetical protein